MTLTLTLNEKQSALLKSGAEALGKPMEEVALSGIEDYLTRKTIINASMNRIIEENAELYRRLAQ